MLVGDVRQVEGEVSWASDGEVGSDVAAVLRKRRDKQANRTRSMMALASPFTPACSTTGRAWLHVRCGAACRNGSQKSQLFVSSYGSLEELNGPWMLSENPPSQCNASEQDLATRFQSEGGGSMECHDVGRVGAVGPDRFGKGSGKLGERAFSRRRRFYPIKPSGKHKRVDDLDLALSRPWSVAQCIAKLGRLGQSLVDSRATQARAETKVTSKVPHGHLDLHSGTDVNPIPVAQESTSSRAGAEEVALAGRDLGTDGVEEAEGGSIGGLKVLAMIRPNAVDEKVIGQGTRRALHRFDQPRPWVEQKSHHGHAEGAALGNAAGVEMGHAQAATHSIVVDA